MVQGTPEPKRRELIRDKARRKGLTKSRKVLSNGRKGRTNGRKAPANGRKGLTCNRKAPSNGRKDPSSGGISRFLLPYRCLKPKSVLRWGVGCGPRVPSSHSSRRGSGFHLSPLARCASLRSLFFWDRTEAHAKAEVAVPATPFLSGRSCGPPRAFRLPTGHSVLFFLSGD